MVLLDSTGGDSFPALVDVLIGMPPSPFFPTVGGLCPEGFVIEDLIDFLCEGGSRQWEPFAPGGTLAIVSVSIRSNPTVNLTASVTSVRVVPEPSSMALSAIGVFAVTLFVRVGRKKGNPRVSFHSRKGIQGRLLKSTSYDPSDNAAVKTAT